MPLGRFIKHKQQYHDKYAVEIHVHRALNITDGSPPSSFFVKYKRGSSHHGTSLRSTAENTSVSFHHCTFTFPCTLYYNSPSKKDYEPKCVTLSVNEDTEKGHKAIGETKINLADFAKKDVDSTGKTFQLTETLVKKKTDPLKLQLTLIMKCIYEGHQTAPGESTPEVQITPGSSPTLRAIQRESTPPVLGSLSGDTESTGSGPSSGSTTPRDTSSLAISIPDGESSINSGSYTPSPRSQAGSPLSASPTRPIPISVPPVPFFATSPRHLPTTMHRQSSDGNLLNTIDITRRLASRHPELCTSPESGSSAGSMAERVIDRHRRTNSEMPDVRKVPVARFRSEPEGMSQSPPDSALHARLAAQEQELMLLKQELALRQQQDDERFLIDEMVMFMHPTYGPDSVPVSAWVIFRAMLHWRAFHPSNTRLLERLTEAFDRLLTRHKSDAEVLLYWLSTTASLLYLFRKELQVLSVGGNVNPKSESSTVKVFEGQLFSFASSFFKLYCEAVQVQLGNVINTMLSNASEVNAQALSCWDAAEIMEVLEAHRAVLTKSSPFDSLREQILRQEMHYIGGRILNTLLDSGGGNTPRKKVNLCTCAHAVGIKMLVVQIDEFMDEKIPWRSTACKQSLAIARQAVDVLVVNKETLVQPNVRADVCPSLSLEQIVRLLESYTPDEFDSDPVHPGVISDLRALIVQENNDKEYDSSPPQKSSLLVDLACSGALETHFTATASCDFSTSVIPLSVLTRPGFNFLRVHSTDYTPWGSV